MEKTDKAEKSRKINFKVSQFSIHESNQTNLACGQWVLIFDTLYPRNSYFLIIKRLFKNTARTIFTNKNFF